MSFFGFAVIAISLLVTALSLNSLAITMNENSLFMNGAAYANVANMETFAYTSHVALQALQNTTLFYFDISGISSIDGINASVSGNSIILKTYAKPTAIYILSK